MRAIRIFNSILIIILTIAPCQANFAQTLGYYQTQKIDTLYSFSKPTFNREPFYFPPIAEFTASLTSGYKVKSYSCQLNHLKIDSLRDYCLLVVRLYSKNIQNIILTANDNKILKRIDFNSDGYQYFMIEIDSSVRTQLNKLTKINASFSVRKPSTDIKLVIGDISIVNISLGLQLSPNKVFVTAPFANMNSKNKIQTSKLAINPIYASFPDNQIKEDWRGVLWIKSSNISNSQLLSEALTSLINIYPFAKERHLNLQTIKFQLRDIFQKRLYSNICELIDTLNTFLSLKIHDPHFYIKSDCEKALNKQTPIYAYKVNGKLVIAAILDTSLDKKVKLGDELVSIQNTPVSKLPDNANINEYIKFSPGTLVGLTVKPKDSSVKQITYTVRQNYKKPSNFNISNLKFKLLNDSTAYYKINRLSASLLADFLSKLDTINTRKKLVLDLRSNGGGEIAVGAEFLSYFIQKDFNYYDLKDYKTSKIYPILVKGHISSQIYRDDGQLVLLVDESTACASELLVFDLKRFHKNTVVLGKCNTRGALALEYLLYLNSKTTCIRTDCVAPGAMLLQGKSIEDVGIKPDHLIKIENVFDLQPYKDKVLRAAIEL